MFDDIEVTGMLDNYVQPDPQLLRLLDKVDDLQMEVTKWKSIAGDLYVTCSQTRTDFKPTSMLLYEENIRESNSTD